MELSDLEFNVKEFLKSDNRRRTHRSSPADGSDSPLPKESAASGPQPPNQGNGSKRERPKTILALMEYAYSEAGRKLNLSRKDLFELVDTTRG